MLKCNYWGINPIDYDVESMIISLEPDYKKTSSSCENLKRKLLQGNVYK